MILTLLAVASALGQPPAYRPSLKLPAIFGSNMVLQRGVPVNVWGWTHPSQKVTVTFRGQSAEVQADFTGKWSAQLKPMVAGGPDEMGIYDESDEVVFSNVLVGDVWLCSGQSNMAYPMSKVPKGEDALKGTNLDQIRLFKVPFQATDEPRNDVRARWETSSMRSASMFSAVAFLFGRSIFESEKVPIGLVEATWGGSPVEAWMPRSTIWAEPSLRGLIDRYELAKVQNRTKLEAYQRVRFKARRGYHLDPGNRGYVLGYSSERFDDREWPEIQVPGAWENRLPEMDIDGAVWFRRVVNISTSYEGKSGTLNLGQIADYDTVYWNGQRIGSTPTNEDAPAEKVREYRIPGRLVNKGENVLAVRIFNRAGQGGFISEDQDPYVQFDGSPLRLSLAGSWRCKVEQSLSPSTIKPLEMPFGPGHPHAPANLFNGMIAPIAPYAVTGFAWYQGESNADRAKQYETLLRRLILGWRNTFKQGDLPFLIVQLPNFRERQAEPGDATWAELREAQMKALTLPRVGLAVTIDLGNPSDIHPTNKQGVAERLAEAARQIAYFTTARGLPPVYDGFRREKGKFRILFRNTAGSMKTSDGQPVRGFAIAGADRKWFWAQASIEGEDIVVSHPLVPEPAAVRYAWADNPDCNLVNRAGMPASPFRTDDWPGITSER